MDKYNRNKDGFKVEHDVPLSNEPEEEKEEKAGEDDLPHKIKLRSRKQYQDGCGTEN